MKRIVRQCITCFKFTTKLTKPFMAPLPEMRLNSSQAFEFVGVDYAGPIIIKSRSGRESIKSKSYICLFICYVTKAVHIELVVDLSKESFLSVSNRFVPRRRRPVCILI